MTFSFPKKAPALDQTKYRELVVEAILEQSIELLSDSITNILALSHSLEQDKNILAQKILFNKYCNFLKPGECIGECVVHDHLQYKTALGILDQLISVAQKTNCWLIEGSRCRDHVDSLTKQFLNEYRKAHVISNRTPETLLPCKLSSMNQHVTVDAYFCYFGIPRSMQSQIVEKLQQLRKDVVRDILEIQIIMGSEIFLQNHKTITA
ncbi:hypothetical protein [Chlamydia ibidis]|nr:hypothetical protein [Chlamydia ibidis]